MSIKRNFIYNLVLHLSNVIFPIITIPYTSRVLGVEQIGIFSFVTTIVSYFILFASLGIPLYGTREIAKVADNKVKVNKLFNEIFSVNIVTSILTSLIFLLSITSIPLLIEKQGYFFLSGISLYLSALNIDWFFSGKENFSLIAKRSIIIKAISIGCLFLFVKSENDLIWYILLNSLSLIGNQLWNIFTFNKEGYKIKFTLSSIEKHIKPLFILFLSTAAMQVYLMIDTLMLGFISTYHEVGLYTSAVKSIRIVMPVITALGIVLIPKLSYYNTNEGQGNIQLILDKAFDVVNTLSVPLSVYFYCIADRFVPLFFGNEFIGAITPMKICASLIFISNLSYFFSVQVLTSQQKEMGLLISTIGGMVVNVVGNCLLIPKFGASGASIASVAGEICVALIGVFFVYKYKIFKANWKSILITAFCCIPFILAYWVIDLEINNFNWILIFSLISWPLFVAMKLALHKNSYSSITLINLNNKLCRYFKAY